MLRYAALVCALASNCALAQPTKIELTAPPGLAKDIDAFPKLIGDDPIFAQINADLAERDAAALAESQDCLSKDGSDWAHGVEVTFAGPRYLNYIAFDSYYCAGAAHPDNNQSSVTYDLTTGRTVNWRDLLPPSLVASGSVDNGTAQDPIGSDALTSLYLAKYPADADQECKDVVRDVDLAFIFHLDAGEHAVKLTPSFLPHAVQACTEVASIPVSELRSLGAAPDLIDALAAD